MSDENTKTRWHLLLGTLLEYLLPPVGIQVSIEPPVMSDPPKADIILLRRDTDDWTPEQKARLSDGIRDTNASHILLEFKYTESITTDAVQQILGYEFFYRKSQNLKPEQLACFLISAKKPQTATLKKFNYQATEQQGIYQSDNLLLQKIPLISLNELPNTAHNAWLRCFASKQIEKKRAFQCIEPKTIEQTSLKLYWFMSGLLKFLLNTVEVDTMKIEVTPEDVLKYVELLEEVGWHSVIERHLQKLDAQEILKGLSAKQRLEGLNPKERLEGLKPAERLEGLKPEERLEGLDPEMIEAYLQKLKQNKQH